jgi:transposase
MLDVKKCKSNCQTQLTNEIKVQESTIEEIFGETVQLMSNYGVGIDTHSKFIAVCVYVKFGHNIKKYEREYNTTWEGLNHAKEFIQNIILTKSEPQIKVSNLRYTIESTGTYHLPVIKAFGGSPSIVNPLLANPSRRKTDRLDARLLAYQSMTGLWPESFLVSEELQQLRILYSLRRSEKRAALRTSNRINNYLLRFGHTIGANGSVTRKIENRALIEDMCKNEYVYINNSEIAATNFICPDGIPEKMKEVILSMYKEFDIHKENEKNYEKELLNSAKSIKWKTEKGEINGNEMLKLLTSVPGIGEITAATWLTEVIDPFRFNDAKQVAAFCGCDPSLKVSAGKVTSQTRRKGNAELHHALILAAGICIQRKNEPFGQWGNGIYARTGKWKKAAGAVARRLSQALYYVHKKGEPFTYDGYNFYKIEVLEMSVDNMKLTARVMKILKNAGFSSTKEVCDAYKSGTLRKIKGLGEKAYGELHEWIEANKRKTK